jgi:membrane associated rhomboid family serine protease
VLSLFATMVLHGSWLHLLGNMWFLWVFGNNVEDRLGRLRYVGFYVVGGLAASLGQVAVSPNAIVPMIGASGAIAAVLGAYLFLFPKAKVLAVVLPFFFLPFVVPAWLLLLVWLALQFFTNLNSGVAWVAHVSGFLFGLVVMAVAARRRRGVIASRR